MKISNFKLKIFERFEAILAIAMLLSAIGFNLWLYRLEPTATIDPNDNAFQFALVDRTNQIWDFAGKKCSINPLCFTAYLVDHWVPNWAEGYNLPYYYSHLPQIAIVASWRFLQLFTSHISLFTYYHWIIYLLLSFFPLSVFLALRVIRLPWLAAGVGALLASQISTDGLYGLDPPSFLWRGYGLSSQLFAMIWMPLGIAYSWRYLTQSTKSEARISDSGHARRLARQNDVMLGSVATPASGSDFWPAVFFLVATAAGHLGLGMIALLSLIPLVVRSNPPIKRLILLAGTTVFFLSYWVVPIVLGDNYHNISFWDPPWKFNSFGAKETIVHLLNGDLFDWGRGPWMTGLVIVGLIAALWPKKELRMKNEELRDKNNSYFCFSLLFLFWLFLYFGRTPWGGFIDLIPGMKEFHLSRFIVGVHAAGLLLMPIGFQALINLLILTAKTIESRMKNEELRKFFPISILHSPFSILVSIIISVVIVPPIYKQTVSYSSHNDRLIRQANENHAKVKPDEEALFAAIRALPPGRVFAGRGGWWGKDFRVAETPYYMNLSTYGIPTVLWLPETWSPNSDVEQYFSEDQAKDYDLFGIRYVAAPPKQEAQKFWKLIAERPTWKLYEIENVGYFTAGVRPAIVATDKRSYGNVVRLWIQSDAHGKGLFPELTFLKDYPRTTGLPNFKMLDEVTYRVPDGSTHNLFQEPPVYLPPGWEQLANPANPTNKPIIASEENDSDMIFKATVTVADNCVECVIVLKQSFHPNWRVTIDGKPAEKFTVFPFFLATLVPTGTHEVVFSYEPSGLKVGLLLLEIATLLAVVLRPHITLSGKHVRGR